MPQQTAPDIRWISYRIVWHHLAEGGYVRGGLSGGICWPNVTARTVWPGLWTTYGGELVSGNMCCLLTNHISTSIMLTGVWEWIAASVRDNADACVLRSDRFGSGSVMAWGGIARNRHIALMWSCWKPQCTGIQRWNPNAACIANEMPEWHSSRTTPVLTLHVSTWHFSPNTTTMCCPGHPYHQITHQLSKCVGPTR